MNLRDCLVLLVLNSLCCANLRAAEAEGVAERAPTLEKVIRLYEGAAPGSENAQQDESEVFNPFIQTRLVYNVVAPTLTLIEPDPAEANGTAVIVCPGGGFHFLSMDTEGIEVAQSLAAKGVTSFVLKYRLLECKTEDPLTEMMQHLADFDKITASTFKLATADGLAAIEYVREHAEDYDIDPDRIGIIGFSAGGMITSAIAYNYTEETRPDFVAAIYPGWKKKPGIEVPTDAPPLFILAATDDQIGLAPDSVALYQDWTAAKQSAELHLYAHGGHGFGMRKQNLPSDTWIDRFTDWLDEQGLLEK